MTRHFTLLAALLAALFAPAPPAAAQEGYRIRAGDVLRIEVLEDATLNRTTLVPPDGRISLPLAGAIPAAGRSVEQVQAGIAAALAPNFAAAPSVFVSIERLAEIVPRGPAGPMVEPVITVFVVGEAARAGKLAVTPGTTFLQLVSEMGGFSNFAATKRIQLRRMDPASGIEKIYTFNYDAIERGLTQAGNTVIADGDVILVPQRKLFE